MRTCVCGPIRKDPYRDYKQRSMLFCSRPCSRRVCECVCVLGVGRAGITQLSSRGSHIYALNSLLDQKAFFSLGVFSSPKRPHTCRCAPAYTDSRAAGMCIQADTNEHKIMLIYSMHFNGFTSAWDSDRKICMLIIGTGVKQYVCECVCADGCVGDWSCHQLAVKMTVNYWAAATYFPCGTSGMTCNFLTITFQNGF